ncbi:MAG: BglG family transcription antiterminator [Anaerolineales bacterium]|nr:BglG family transcription antiterminator [Anaerolineales bacterium]
MADRLDASIRQVRYSLKQSEPWMARQDISLHTGPQGEKWFSLEPDKRNRLVRQLEQCVGFTYLLSNSERIQFELLEILTSREPVLIQHLQNILGVSRTTIRRDFAQVTDWLAEHDLGLNGKPHVGIHYTGSEIAYRDALVELMTMIIGIDKLLAILKSHGFRRPESDGTLLQKAAGSFLASHDHYGAAALVLDKVQHHDMADADLVSIFLYLTISAQRIANGHLAVLEKTLIESIRNHQSFELTTSWCRTITRLGRNEIPEDEVAALAVRLACARKVDYSIKLDSVPQVATTEELDLIVNTIVQVASQRLHPFLRIDPLLSRGLTIHLAATLERIRFGRPESSLLERELRAMYPGVYTIAKECNESVKSITGLSLPDEEIAFITMHLGAAVERLRTRPSRRILVVCSEGIATAWLLMSRLRATFPFIDIVNVMSVRELHRTVICRLTIDMIISTVKLSCSVVPTIVVSPLLSAKDIAELSDVLEMEPVNESTKKVDGDDLEGPDLADMVSAMRLQSPATDWQQVTREVGALLVKQGIAEPCYTDGMIALLKHHGPYMVIAPGVALLHALPSEGALRLGMSLVTLSEPIPFGHETNDPVGIVFAFACTNSMGHIRGLSQLVDLLDNPSALAGIQNARRSDQVRKVLLWVKPAY